MADYFIHEGNWIAEDGSYGSGQVLHFDYHDLEEYQLDIVDSLGDNQRFDYIYAILNNEDLSRWEND